MRKPSSTIILSALLAFSWVWFLVINSGAAQEERPSSAKWEYFFTDDYGKLKEVGKTGWEAYAVTEVDRNRIKFWCKRRIQ